MKRYLKFFFILVLVEIFIMFGIFLLQSLSLTSYLQRFLSIVSLLFSMPLVLLNRGYPYWTQGNGYFSFILILSTWIIHAIFLILFIKLWKAFREVLSKD